MRRPGAEPAYDEEDRPEPRGVDLRREGMDPYHAQFQVDPGSEEDNYQSYKPGPPRLHGWDSPMGRNLGREDGVPSRMTGHPSPRPRPQDMNPIERDEDGNLTSTIGKESRRKFDDPRKALRHHVSGAVERGEKSPIVEMKREESNGGG